MPTSSKPQVKEPVCERRISESSSTDRDDPIERVHCDAEAREARNRGMKEVSVRVVEGREVFSMADTMEKEKKQEAILFSLFYLYVNL